MYHFAITRYFFGAIVLFFTLSCSVGSASNFQEAKRILPSIFKGHETTFYCGCAYQAKQIDLQSCGYQVRKNPQRAQRLEWEHIVPAHTFGHNLACWKAGGRKGCQHDPLYNQMEGDLVNLVPSIGEVNGDRSNFRFTVWTQETGNQYGRCPIMIDFQKRQVQPPVATRGTIARTYLYMELTHRIPLSAQEKKLFCAWAKTYPISAWEIERNQRIQRYQPTGNPLIAQAGLLTRICQF